MPTLLAVGVNRVSRSALPLRLLLVNNMGRPQTRPFPVVRVNSIIGTPSSSVSSLCLVNYGDRRFFYFSTRSSSSSSSKAAAQEMWNDDDHDDDEDDYHTKSKRKQFKETPVHPSIRRYVEMIGVGIPNRRKGAKRLRSHLFDHIEEGRRRTSRDPIQPPPPFSCSSSSWNDDDTSSDPPTGQGRRVVVIGSVSTIEDTFPTNKESVPEVALAGRSNVGKSTLLNALLYGNQIRQPRKSDEDGYARGGSSKNQHHNNLIRRHNRKGKTPENVKMPRGIKAVVSPKPGETQRITFYQLGGTSSSGNSATKRHNFLEEQDQHGARGTRGSRTKTTAKGIRKNPNHKLRLVDLPGYGFSFAPRMHDGFQDLLLQYLLERGKALKRVLLLIDARHGFKKADIEFLQTMEMETYKSTKRKMPAIQIVLTKCDLVQRDDLARRVVHVRQELSDTLRRETSSLPVLLVSARAGVGYNNVKNKRNGGPPRARGGVLELQKELAALVPLHHEKKNKTDNTNS